MRLKPGDRAIPFSAETTDGNTISLEQVAGKPLLLMFYRYASCPMCNLRLRDFAQNYSRLHERGLEVVAFFHSPAGNIRANAGKQHYPFHLVADPRFNVYRSYGIETSWLRFFTSMLLPGFYVNWIRLKAHYGRDMGDHLSIAEVEAVLTDLSIPHQL